MKNHLDAKGFVAWLDEQNVTMPNDGSHQGVSRDTEVERWSRALYRWRHESECVSVYTADEFLIYIGLHLTSVPESLYRDRSYGGNVKKISLAQKMDIVNYDANHKDTARKFHVNSRSVGVWRRQHREGVLK